MAQVKSHIAVCPLDFSLIEIVKTKISKSIPSYCGLLDFSLREIV